MEWDPLLKNLHISFDFSYFIQNWNCLSFIQGLHWSQTKPIIASALVLSMIMGACVRTFIGGPRIATYKDYYELVNLNSLHLHLPPSSHMKCNTWWNCSLLHTMRYCDFFIIPPQGVLVVYHKWLIVFITYRVLQLAYIYFILRYWSGKIVSFQYIHWFVNLPHHSATFGRLYLVEKANRYSSLPVNRFFFRLQVSQTRQL